MWPARPEAQIQNPESAAGPSSGRHLADSGQPPLPTQQRQRKVRSESEGAPSSGILSGDHGGSVSASSTPILRAAGWARVLSLNKLASKRCDQLPRGHWGSLRVCPCHIITSHLELKGSATQQRKISAFNAGLAFAKICARKNLRSVIPSLQLLAPVGHLVMRHAEKEAVLRFVPI